MEIIKNRRGGENINKKIGVLTAILMIFVFCVGMAGTVTAAKTKMVDKGSIKKTTSIGYTKFSWITYQKGSSYVKVKGWIYVAAINKSFRTIFIMQKVSKSKMKLTMYFDGKKVDSTYDYTKLTAAQYYWRLFRPGMYYDFLSEM